MGIKSASKWTHSRGPWQFMQGSNSMMRTQWQSSLTCRNLVLSLLPLYWLSISPLSLTLLLIRPLGVHGLSLHPGGWRVSPSFSGSMLVGPHPGSLIASGWPSYNGPSGEGPHSTGTQIPGVISLWGLVSFEPLPMCVTTLLLWPKDPATFCTHVLLVGRPIRRVGYPSPWEIKYCLYQHFSLPYS